MAGRAPVEVLGRIEASLRHGGFRMTRDSVGGRQAVIGRRAAFPRPGLARLHTFVLAAVFEGGTARPDKLDRFLEESGLYARTLKGGLSLGRGSGAAAVAVAVAESADDAGGWATGPHDRTFAAVAFPVLVDVGRRSVTCPTRLVTGAAYEPYLRRVVADHVAPAVEAPAD